MSGWGWTAEVTEKHTAESAQCYWKVLKHCSLEPWRNTAGGCSVSWVWKGKDCRRKSLHYLQVPACAVVKQVQGKLLPLVVGYRPFFFELEESQRLLCESCSILSRWIVRVIAVFVSAALWQLRLTQVVSSSYPAGMGEAGVSNVLYLKSLISAPTHPSLREIS